MSKLLAILLGLLAFALLCYLCITKHVPEMLGAMNTPTVVNANVNTNANVALGSASFKAETKDGKVVLTGVLPDQATKDQLLARAREVYGAENIVDNLTVDAKVGKPSWLASVLGLLPFTAKDVKNGGLSVEKNSISLIGQVTSEDIKAKVYKDASIAFPNATINNLLTVGNTTMTADQESTQAQINEQIAGKVIEFDSGSDQMTTRGKAVLDELAPIFEKSPDTNFEVGGHTDAQGDDGSNLKLSQRRAVTVKNYLVGKNLKAERFTAKGYGETQPIADNNTDEGRQRNRRIAFTVKGGK
jgi:OmpA-OmpF porin, OOP family